MDGKDGKRETLTYIVIAFFVIIVIIFAVIFSNNELELAYIHHNFLGENWHEDIAERETGSHLFGLEKFGSLTYKINDKYPASLTVTTIKTLVMMKENELREKTAETIHQALEGKIVINKDTEVIGERVLKNGHKTMYFVYDGDDTSSDDLGPDGHRAPQRAPDYDGRFPIHIDSICSTYGDVLSAHLDADFLNLQFRVEVSCLPFLQNQSMKVGNTRLRSFCPFLGNPP